jgi:hypothetical protein
MDGLRTLRAALRGFPVGSLILGMGKTLMPGGVVKSSPASQGWADLGGFAEYASYIQPALYDRREVL